MRDFIPEMNLVNVLTKSEYRTCSSHYVQTSQMSGELWCAMTALPARASCRDRNVAFSAS